jgi:Family of unknown function (DUF6328)
MSDEERDETDAERQDRNYSELLQELRVAQTGVQILFAFLLTIPFQQRFTTLSSVMHGLYVATLSCAAIAAALFIAPAAVHRVVFRRHLKYELVSWTGRLAAAGLAFLALTVLGAVLLVVDVVSGPVAAWILTAALACLFGSLWYVLPARWLTGDRALPGDADDPDRVRG